jgi:AbiV family abortive infection protein
MGTTFKKIPGDDELLRIAVAAAENAMRKLRSAALLLADEQWPEAFYNAALGLEEAGKAQMCINMLSLPMWVRDGVGPKGFTKWFNGHEDKAQFAHFLLRGMLDDDVPDTLVELIDQVAAAATATNDVKFRGLYADMGSDGQVLHPKDVTAEEARWAVECLERMCTWMPRIAALDSGFLQYVAGVRENTGFVGILAALAGEDDVRPVREVREMMRFDGPAPEWAADVLGLLPEVSEAPKLPAADGRQPHS